MRQENKETGTPQTLDTKFELMAVELSHWVVYITNKTSVLLQVLDEVKMSLLLCLTYISAWRYAISDKFAATFRQRIPLDYQALGVPRLARFLSPSMYSHEAPNASFTGGRKHVSKGKSGFRHAQRAPS